MLFRDTEIAALEALMFVAKEPLCAQKLAEILEISPENVIELMQILKERYSLAASGFTLIELENGYRLGTKPEMAGISKFYTNNPSDAVECRPGSLIDHCL